MKKMLVDKLKDVSKAEQDKLFAMIEKNPDLFQKIATEAQEKIKGGSDQMTAMMSVAKKYEDELKKLM